MQMTRRFLSMILAVAMICGMLTGITISASAVSVSGSFVKYTAEADGTSADTLYVLLKVDQFKFLRPILPGDVMTVSVSKKSKAGPLLTFEAAVHVGDTLCSNGCVSFTAMPKQNLEES